MAAPRSWRLGLVVCVEWLLLGLVLVELATREPPPRAPFSSPPLPTSTRLGCDGWESDADGGTSWPADGPFDDDGADVALPAACLLG